MRPNATIRQMVPWRAGLCLLAIPLWTKPLVDHHGVLGGVVSMLMCIVWSSITFPFVFREVKP